MMNKKQGASASPPCGWLPEPETPAEFPESSRKSMTGYGGVENTRLKRNAQAMSSLLLEIREIVRNEMQGLSFLFSRR